MKGRTPTMRLPTWALPSDTLTPRQRQIVALMALASMSAAFTNTLFTQTVAYAADEFGVATSGQGIGAAVVRWGIIICLPLVVLADRRGRRPMVLTVAWVAPIVCALGAIAPSFPILVATQTIGRPLGLTLDILIAVIAIEEMPKNSRAFATGVLAMCSGFGAGIAVTALPLADLGERSWRLVYLITLVWLGIAVALTKWLPESQRFERQHNTFSARHLRSLPALRRNLGRICTVVFLTNVYIATASIFQNRYLKETRGYSAALVALFTIATSMPAGLGLLVGGRIADERGRRILGATMVPVGALLMAMSFAVSGTAMWVIAIAGGLALGISYPAMAVYRGELFPTHVRSIAGGIIMTSALIGGSIGLIGGGYVLDTGINYGTVMLWLALGPIVASLIVWFRYPETAHLELEDIVPDDVDSATKM
ncbi:MAG: MFS transporter [Actinobacteria bacterium]|nr:MFS transporter [Actinomycetota bacterium]